MSKKALPSGNKMNLRERKSRPPADRPPEPRSAGPAPAARPAVCGLCDAQCGDVESCAAHIAHEHAAHMRLCPRCARAFLTDQQLREHTAKHTRRGHSIISCAHCPVHFSRLTLLERHDSLRHEREGPGVCLARYLPYLSASVNTNFAIFYNTLRSRSAAIKIVCKVCKFHSTSLDEYLGHVKEKCGKKYVCDRCNNIFVRRKSLQAHYNSSKNSKCRTPGYAPSLLPASKKTAKCAQCRKTFSNCESYYRHVKMCNRYECTKCNLVFESLTAYNAHHSELHNEPLKLFNCTYCRMEFVTEPLLVRHTKQHERYSCLKCDKKFGTPKPLLVHLKVAHPNVHPYKCLICDTSFQEGLHFKTHITSHKEKAYINFDKNHFVTYSHTAPANPAVSGEAAEASNATESVGVASAESANVDDTLNSANDDTDAECVKGAIKIKKRPIKKMTRRAIQDRSTYNAKKTFQCKVCSKRTGDLVAYNKHVNLHFQKGAKQCVSCAKIFRNRQALEKHELETHKTSKTTNKLHKYLKERAERKLQAIREMQRARKPQKPEPKKLPPLPKPPPFKMRLKRVAAPTYDVIQNGQIVTNSKEVTIRDHAMSTSKQKLRDLTAQSYVESFQPDQTMDVIANIENNEKQKSSIKRLTMNKSLKIRSVRSTVASKMFKIKSKKFQETKPNATSGLAKPVPYKRTYTEPVNVTVSMTETYSPRTPCLDFGEDPTITEVYEDVYDADYFETDDHNVAQIEVLSTPAPSDAKQRVQVQRGKKYMLEISAGEPTTEEIEEKLAEVCKKLEYQVPKNELHIGQLTTSAPFYKVINVRKIMRKHAKQQKEEKIKKRFEQIKIGSAEMVIANPLEHLMKKANITLGDKDKAKRINVKTVQSS